VLLGDTHDYDIALLKVRTKDGEGIKFNDYVQPACLPASADVYRAGLKCLISGWGETGEDSESLFKLHGRHGQFIDKFCYLIQA
jgi:hypothetical protein